MSPAAARALQGRAGRRVPGHRPGAVADRLPRVFGDGTLEVVIGDPKQAIYAFRGADVYAYLDAAREAATHATLDVNWRSDQGLIDAYDALFGGARSATRGSSTAGPRDRVRTAHARLTGAPVTRRCGSASCTATSRRSPHDAARLRAHRARRASTSPTTSPPTSCGCSTRTRTVGGEPVDARPRRRARADQPRRRARARRARRRSASPRSSTAPAACSARRRRASGCGCWRRSSGRRRAPRAHAAALTPFLGWSAERIAAAGDEELGGRPPAPARAGRACCAPRRRVADRDDHARRGAARARARRGRRRAAADRPAPRRPAAARRGDDRAARHDRARRVAAPADRRGRPGHRRRGPQPPPGVRRRGGPGPHRAPQQGARVPDRLLPVPVGARVHPDGPAGRLPRPGRRRPAHDRRRARGRRTSTATRSST